MILGTEVFTELKNESGLSQKSMSSHWREYLKDFNYEKDNFSVKGLDDGRGGRRRKFIMLLDYIFQTAYRKQGKQFSTFKKILQHANDAIYQYVILQCINMQFAMYKYCNIQVLQCTYIAILKYTNTAIY